MLIHEAAVVFDTHKDAAISRKKWLEGGAVVRRISFDNVWHEFRDIVFSDDGFHSKTWRPAMEDMTADDWFQMRRTPKGSKVRWVPRGLL